MKEENMGQKSERSWTKEQLSAINERKKTLLELSFE